MNKISVAFICDDNYFMPTAVAITSLISNKNPDTYYDIYVITANLPDKKKAKICQLKESSVDIHIIKASSEKFKGIYKTGYVTCTTYLKFDLPDLIPDQDKVLYLDSDIIIQKDLSDLFEINITDYYAGVVKDIPLIDNDLNIKNYFNSGVMLLNLKLMRENDSSAELINIAKSTEKLKFMDQDCFNMVFNNKVKLLPAIYNCFYELFLQEGEKYTIGNINKCFEADYSSLDDLKEESYIIHLVGSDKPWLYFDSLLVNEWDRYFKKSPFGHLKLIRKSIKLREFIFSLKFVILPYIFYRYWRDKGFRFAMGKVRKRLLGSKLW